MEDIAKNLQRIKARIRRAETHYQRTPGDVKLLAVSKTKTAAAIRQAYNAGQKAFGENYCQEAAEKQKILSDCDIEWHFIGAIQANKTRYIAEHFDWVHGVNRFKVVKRLNAQRPAFLQPLNVCIEVNIDNEATKSGITPEMLLSLISETSGLEKLRLRGLMVIPKYEENVKVQKLLFEKVAALQQDLIDNGFDLDTLSMGMSHDFEAAIAAGSTIIRLGTAIFGARER